MAINIQAPLPVSFEDTATAFSAKNNLELKRTYWLFKMVNQAWLVKPGTSMVKFALKLRLPIKWLVKPTLFAQFCGGESIEDCQNTIDKLYQHQVKTILDYSVEGEKHEAGLEATAEEVIRNIDRSAEAPDKIPFAVFKMTGIIAFSLLEKIQAQKKLSPKEEVAWQKAQARLERLCQHAQHKGVRLLIDAEESWIQGSIDALVYQMMAKYNREQAIIYNTYQLYCHQALPNLKKAYANAEAQGYYFGAKLVRGAYMEKERARAQEFGYPDPIQPNKTATDRDYNEAQRFCIEHIERIGLCAGSHNEESNYLLVKLMQERQLPPNFENVYFAQLYGMSEHISYNLAKAGYNVAKYVPYGPVAAVLPYLFRRAEENTSVEGQSSREYTLVQREMRRRRQSK